MKILKWLANLFQSYPMKSIFITVTIVVLLASGVRNVFMATGNDTLVKSSTDVYKDNLMLEEEFGGESIIVLYESDHLLTPENLAHMKGLENALQTSDSIYSILSPVTLVEEIANKQGEKFQDGIEEVINGLDTMGSKLNEIGTEMEKNAQNNQGIGFLEQEGFEMPKLGSTELPNIEGQLAELNKGFTQLIDAQGNLGDGTQNLVNGYVQFATKTNELAEALGIIADQMGDSPQQAQQLLKVSGGLNQLSEQMLAISKNTAQLPGISTQTINGLESIQKKLSGQLNEQKKQQEQMQVELKKQQEVKQEEIKEQIQELQKKMQGKMDEQATNLSTLANGLIEMGENLQTISENMETIHGYADIMTPGLPTKQATLDNMVCDEGELRHMFEEVIVDDQYMLMMIRFKGNRTDVEKSEVVGRIKDYLEAEKIDSVETIVSGKPVLDNAIRSSMQESMQVMLALALAFMVIVLFLVFNVSWRLLSLATVLTAVIATIGTMGWLNIPITMVSMAVFPILIGLGIDYGIQFHNRYTEEMSREEVGND